MTLLLGPPSSGKSTLLKALSGRLHMAGLKYHGEVRLRHTIDLLLQASSAVRPNLYDAAAQDPLPPHHFGNRRSLTMGSLSRTLLCNVPQPT